MPTQDTSLYVASESFATVLDGQNIVVQKGVTRVRAGHPLLKGREMYFEPLKVHFDIETATAKPGEARGAPAPAPVQAPTPAPEPVKPEPAKAEPETTEAKPRSKGLTTDSIKPKTSSDA